MNAKQIFLIVIIIFCMCRSGVHSAEPMPRLQKITSPTIDGASILIEIPAEAKAGSAVLLTAHIRNTGGKLVVVRHDSTVSNATIVENMSRDGKAVPFTRYGKRELDPTELDNPFAKLGGSIRGTYINTNDSSNISVPNLALFYDLTLPGEYVFTVTRFVEVGDKDNLKVVKLQTKPIHFKVIDPD